MYLEYHDLQLSLNYYCYGKCRTYSELVSIPAQTPSSEITSDESYLAMLTVPSTPVEDNATFSITALNSRGAGFLPYQHQQCMCILH